MYLAAATYWRCVVKKDLKTRIESLMPAARGTVSEVRKPCIRENCPACRSGRKHRSFLYAYSERDGTRRCLHVPRELVPELRRMLANGREIDRLLFAAGAEFVRTRGGRRS